LFLLFFLLKTWPCEQIPVFLMIIGPASARLDVDEPRQRVLVLKTKQSFDLPNLLALSVSATGGASPGMNSNNLSGGEL
jgi:hypothetical protein